jgi:beta-lactamase regulating signal transducer with metallopeptidase domain
MCINQLQSFYLSLNVTALDKLLPSRFFENSTIQELVNQLMVEEWNPSIMYEKYYNECQLSQCTYTHETKNNVIYIVTTLLGLVGGLITVLKLIVPRIVMALRKKKELSRVENGKKGSKIAVIYVIQINIVINKQF